MGAGYYSKPKRREPHEAYQRRRVISAIPPVPVTKGIKVITEYVETSQSTVIYTTCFYPGKSIVEKPKGLICQVLGYGDYTDYSFSKIAQYFAEAGYIFFVWDARGHGRSSGLWMHIESMNVFMNDAMYICRFAQNKYKCQDKYLFGTSMGGNVVCRILINEEHNKRKDFISSWNGVILFSPMIGIDPSVKPNAFTTYLAKNVFSYYLPKATLLIKGKSSTLRSRDPEVNAWLEDNPLIFPFGPRPQMGIEMLDTCDFVEQNASKIGLTGVALLVLHGTGDTVTRSSRSFKLVEDIMKVEPKNDAKHRTFSDGCHVLMNDVCREQCRKVVIDWMEQHATTID